MGPAGRGAASNRPGLNSSSRIRSASQRTRGAPVLIDRNGEPGVARGRWQQRRLEEWGSKRVGRSLGSFLSARRRDLRLPGALGQPAPELCAAPLQALADLKGVELCYDGPGHRLYVDGDGRI